MVQYIFLSFFKTHICHAPVGGGEKLFIFNYNSKLEKHNEEINKIKQKQIELCQLQYQRNKSKQKVKKNAF